MTLGFMRAAVASTLLVFLIADVGCATRRLGAQAGGTGGQKPLRLPSGEWTLTILTRFPGSAEVRRERKTHCVRGDTFDPAIFVPGLGNCVLTDRMAAATATTWRIRCSANGRPAEGFGEIVIEGERTGGGMHLEVQAGRSSEIIDAAWTGVRVGPCTDRSPGRDRRHALPIPHATRPRAPR